MGTAPVKAIALQQCTEPTLSFNHTCLSSIRTRALDLARALSRIRARVDAEGSAL